MHVRRSTLGRLGFMAGFLLLVLLWSAAADARERRVMANTVVLVGGAGAIALPAGTLLALFLVKTDLPGRRLAALLLVVLLLVPLYLQAAAWQAGFGIQGWFTSFTTESMTPPALGSGGIPQPPPAFIDGMRGAIWIHALAAIPWVALIVAIGLLLMEPELEEEALLYGSPRQVFQYVTLRRALVSMIAAAIWVSVGVAGEMTVTDLLGIRTLAEMVYDPAKFSEPPISVFAGVAWTALLIGLALALVAGLTPQLTQVSFARQRRWLLGRFRWPAAGLVWLGLVILAVIPLGNLVYKAGVVVSNVRGDIVRSWSITKGAAMVVTSPAEHDQELFWSGVMAAGAACFVVVVSVLLAWRACRKDKGPLIILIVAAVCLAIPGPILGVSVAWLMSEGARSSRFAAFLYDRTIAAPLLVQTVKALPLPLLIMWHGFATLSRDTLESAETEGASRTTQLWRIAMPERWPTLLSAWVLAFIIAFGELSATLLAYPPGMTPLTVRVFGLIHYGVEDKVAGICLFLTALVALLAGIAWMAQKARFSAEDDAV